MGTVETVEPALLIEDDSSKSQTRLDEARHGGVMVIETDSCGIADPAIDVASSHQAMDLRLVSEIHAGLTRLVENGTVQAEPDLAESFEVSDDGRVYDFLLRDDLKFSDGSVLTASDVKWSWERSLRKSTGKSRANEVLGIIEGADAIVAGESQDLAGVTVIDDRRMRVTLSEPRATFDMLLSDPVASVLHRENVSHWDEVWANDPVFPSEVIGFTGLRVRNLPVGAGPFKLTEYAQLEDTFQGFSGEARCVLERNANHWNDDLYLDGIIAKVVPDLWVDATAPERHRHALDAGELDIGVQRSEVDLRSTADGRGLRTQRMQEAPWSQFLVLNPAHPPFDDLHFRRALAKSINVHDATRLKEGVTNLKRLVPESIAPTNSSVSGFEYSPSSALTDLDRSRYSGATQFSPISHFVLHNVEPLINHVSSVFDAWRDLLGVDIEIHEFEFVIDENDPSVARIKPPLEDLHIAEIRVTPSYPSLTKCYDTSFMLSGSETRLPKLQRFNG